MKTIIIDPFDKHSIDKAVSELKRFEEEREKKIKKYVHRLAEIGADAARNAYFGGSVHPNHMPSNTEGLRISVKDYDNGSAIFAEGSQVIFLEFGAGIYTKNHDLSGPLGIDVSPGSYSLTEGAGTYQDVLDGKVKPEEYRYNRTPRAGMWAAYKAIVEAQDRVAHEVFDND